MGDRQHKKINAGRISKILVINIIQGEIYLSVWIFFIFMVLWLVGQGIYFWKKIK